MTEPDPLLFRAASFLRAVPEPGWDAISDTVLATVRATPRHGWPLRAAPILGDTATGSIHVSDHALRAILARELRRRFLCRPTAITFTFDDRDGRLLRGVHLDVTGSYGTELRALGDHIRATVADIVHEVLGSPETAGENRPIDVTISDIVTGDPLHNSD